MNTPELSTLQQCFSGRLLVDPTDMAPFLTDWRGKWTGQALAVVQPVTAQDVVQVVRWCHAHQVPVVSQGGRTGMCGGSVPEAQPRCLPILLSLTRLNQVRSIDPLNNTMVVEAGATLQQVQEAALAAGRLFPLSLAAEGSCSIGGNLATNAGGVQVLRYGNARDLCLGLEVVTPRGELWDGLRTLRKDNTGYDLRDLYIGSEGTLGVITAAVLKLYPLPTAQIVALAAVDSPDQALQLLSLAQARQASQLSAFELFSDTCLQLVLRHMPDSRRPLAGAAPWYVLLELSLSAAPEQAQSLAAEAVEALLGEAMELGLVSDAAISANLTQFDALWALRENISEAQGAEGKTIKHDIALPISRLPEFLTHTDAAIAQHFPQVRQVVFGHLGDGNLHYNASPGVGQTGPEHAAGFLALEASMNRLVHDAVHAHGGSISAEHGLGVLRRDESARYKSPVEMQLMRSIKQALDPQNLMNPDKFLPLD